MAPAQFLQQELQMKRSTIVLLDIFWNVLNSPRKTVLKGVLIILWGPIIFCTYSNQLLTIRWLDFEGHIDVFNAAVDSS